LWLAFKLPARVSRLACREHPRDARRMSDLESRRAGSVELGADA
jgi:hypothetical protein